MRIKPTNRQLNRIFWTIAVTITVIGAALPPLFYNWSSTALGSRVEEHSGGLMIALCPPYIGSMAFDHMVASERVKTVAWMALINGVLYFIAGSLIATARESLARRRDSIEG